MRPLSEDLRGRLIKAREQGQSSAEVGKRFGVSRASAFRLWRQYRLTGQCGPKKIGGYRRSRLEGHEKILKRWIKRQVDLTLEELQERCREQLKVRIGINALWHRLDRLGLTYKKNDARRRARAA